jgi:hypothetical protein
VNSDKPAYNPLDADRKAGAETPEQPPKLPKARREMREYATRDLTPNRTGMGYITK